MQSIVLGDNRHSFTCGKSLKFFNYPVSQNEDEFTRLINDVKNRKKKVEKERGEIQQDTCTDTAMTVVVIAKMQFLFICTTLVVRVAENDYFLETVSRCFRFQKQ